MKVRFDLMAQARHATGQTTVEVGCAADATLLQAFTELATRQLPAIREFIFDEGGIGPCEPDADRRWRIGR
jgi:hypothetical protein